MTGTLSGNLAAAIADVEEILQDSVAEPLSAEQLRHYKEHGWVAVRCVVPEKMANVIYEHIMIAGLKNGNLDVHDPKTWGVEKPKGWFASWALSAGSETPYHGRRIGFGHGFEKEYRTDIDDSTFELLKKAWEVVEKVAHRRFCSILDQLVGPGEYQSFANALKRDIHVRYALPAKDPQCSVDDFKWPLIGWHIDGKNHNHFLGRKVEWSGEKRSKPDHAVIAMLVWSKTLPYGGMTGVIDGSHKANMRKILRAEDSGGISNALMLVQQSIFGGKAIDPIAALLDEQVLYAGDAILMHPYLTHSVTFNYQPTLRLGMHLQFNYNLPMNRTTLGELGERQTTGNHHNAPLPPNTELYLEALQESL